MQRYDQEQNFSRSMSTQSYRHLLALHLSQLLFNLCFQVNLFQFDRPTWLAGSWVGGNGRGGPAGFLVSSFDFCTTFSSLEQQAFFPWQQFRRQRRRRSNPCSSQRFACSLACFSISFRRFFRAAYKEGFAFVALLTRTYMSVQTQLEPSPQYSHAVLTRRYFFSIFSMDGVRA